MNDAMAMLTGFAMPKKIVRDYPRDCVHRSARIGWRPDPDNTGLNLKVWRCGKFDVEVDWRDCKERCSE